MERSPFAASSSRLPFLLVCATFAHLAACAIAGTGTGTAPNLVQCPTSTCAPELAPVGKDSSSTSSPSSANFISSSTSGSGRDADADFSSHPNFRLLPSLHECGYEYEARRAVVGAGGRGRRRTKRVVGGKPAEIGSHPWMVQLMIRNLTSDSYRVRCGGTLINNDTILTAAHCVTNIPADAALTRVTLGSYRNQGLSGVAGSLGGLSLSSVHMRNCDVDGDGQRVCWVVHLAQVEEVLVHEEYLVGEARNDVALVRLRDSTHDFRFNASVESWSSNETTRRIFESKQFVRPICLPRRNDVLVGLLGKQFEFVGWGRMSSAPDYVQAPYLNAVKLKWVPNAMCSPVMEKDSAEAASQNELCILGEPGTGTCYGDSGSPLLKSFPAPELGGRQQIFQVGFDSKSGFSQGGCAADGVPDYFTNVVAYMPWILDHLAVAP